MTVGTLMTRVNYTLRALDDDTPTSGDEYDYWLDVLNRKIEEFYEDVTKNWSVSYSVESLGTVTASAAPSYNLPSTFLAASDSVYVITTDDKRIDFTLVKPNERTTLKQNVFIAGIDPEVLYFTSEIKSTDDIVGGELFMPGYFIPDPVTDDADTIPLPDANWAVAAVAAEIAYNDLTYEDKAEGLQARANYLYANMHKKNRRGTYMNPRITPYSIKRIRDTRY